MSFQKHYKVGFGQIKFKSEPIKAPPSSLVTHLPLNTSREYFSSRFQGSLGELGNYSGALCIRGGGLRVGGALRISAHFLVQINSGTTYWRRATHQAGHATRRVSCSGNRQQATKTTSLLKSFQVGL